MRIRLLKPWHVYSRGYVLTPTTGAAKMLIARGIAEEIAETLEPQPPVPQVRKKAKRKKVRA